MIRQRLNMVSASLLALSLAIVAAPASAGDSDHEITDDHEDGATFFGEVKDVAGLKPLESARIKTTLKGTMRSLIGSSDGDGRFKIRGLGRDVDPENVDTPARSPAIVRSMSPASACRKHPTRPSRSSA